MPLNADRVLPASSQFVSLRRMHASMHDAEIGELRPDDRIEFAPLIMEDDARERASWVTSDASPSDLGLVEGEFLGTIETTIVMEWCEPR